MANYRLRDLNRFRKVYPYKRAAPKYAYVYDAIASASGDTTLEAGKITFTDADSGSYTFVRSYASIPSVTISTVDSDGNGDTNVSITVTAISLTSVTVTASAKFTGQVHIHVAPVT
jgi:hypothetical protein